MANDTDLGVAVAVATSMRNDAERFAKASGTSASLSDASADRSEASRAEVEIRQQAIADLIAANIPAHEWDGSRLRIMNPDGSFGGYVDLIGRQGPKGEAGAEGPRGLPGGDGADGADGSDGQDGADGAPGAGIVLKGALDDSSQLIDIVAPNPGDAYLIAAHLWVFGGVSEGWIDSGSVQGPQGEPGAQGSPGPRGYAGSDGARGDSGLDAYEVALNQGFVGSVPEWLASLRGDPQTAAGLQLDSFVGFTPTSLPISDDVADALATLQPAFTGISGGTF